MKHDPKPITSDFTFWLLIVAATLVAGLGLCCGCSPARQVNGYLGQEDDWPGEECLEWALDSGFDIEADLTGSSPE